MEACYDNNNKTSYSKSTRLDREGRGREPVGSRCLHMRFGLSTQEHEITAQGSLIANDKTGKCE
eukprot:6210361-Pleurochrysis_carterae.AAC.1